MNRRNFLCATSALVLTGLLPPHQASGCSQGVLIICDGNSITDSPAYALGNWQPWPYQLAAMTGEQVANVAVGATNIEHCMQRAPLNVDRLVGLVSETWLIIWEGTNYLAKTLDAQLTYQAHVAYCQARRAARIDRIFIGTIISREPSVGYTNAQRWQFNDLVKANYARFADGVIDFAAIPQMGPDGAYANKDYFYDGIHPTDAGSRLLAQKVQESLLVVAGGTIPSERYTNYFPLIAGIK